MLTLKCSERHTYRVTGYFIPIWYLGIYDQAIIIDKHN